MMIIDGMVQLSEHNQRNHTINNKINFLMVPDLKNNNTKTITSSVNISKTIMNLQDKLSHIKHHKTLKANQPLGRELKQETIADLQQRNLLLNYMPHQEERALFSFSEITKH